MIITSGGQKGGVGKTTIAINLAYEKMRQGFNVLLVDTDLQASAAKWIGWRKEQGLQAPKLYQLSGDVYDALLDQEEKYDYIIVDSGGISSVELNSSILASDVFICPIRPGQFDIETLGKMNTVVRHAKASGNRSLRSYVVLTHTPTNPLMEDEKDAKFVLSKLPEFSSIKTSLKYRSAFWRTANDGNALREGTDTKASGEMENVIAEVLQ